MPPPIGSGKVFTLWQHGVADPLVMFVDHGHARTAETKKLAGRSQARTEPLFRLRLFLMD